MTELAGEGAGHLIELGTDGRIILKWVLKKVHGMACTGFHLGQHTDEWHVVMSRVRYFFSI